MSSILQSEENYNNSLGLGISRTFLSPFDQMTLDKFKESTISSEKMDKKTEYCKTFVLRVADKKRALGIIDYDDGYVYKYSPENYSLKLNDKNFTKNVLFTDESDLETTIISSDIMCFLSCIEQFFSLGETLGSLSKEAAIKIASVAIYNAVVLKLLKETESVIKDRNFDYIDSGNQRHMLPSDERKNFYNWPLDCKTQFGPIPTGKEIASLFDKDGLLLPDQWALISAEKSISEAKVRHLFVKEVVSLAFPNFYSKGWRCQNSFAPSDLIRCRKEKWNSNNMSISIDSVRQSIVEAISYQKQGSTIDQEGLLSYYLLFPKGHHFDWLIFNAYNLLVPILNDSFKEGDVFLEKGKHGRPMAIVKPHLNIKTYYKSGAFEDLLHEKETKQPFGIMKTQLIKDISQYVESFKPNFTF
jgi:hypothetical protein